MTGIVASSEAENVLFTTVNRAVVIRNFAVAIGQNTADFVAAAGDPADYQKLPPIAGKGTA